MHTFNSLLKQLCRRFWFYSLAAFMSLGCEEDRINPLSKTLLTGKVIESNNSQPIGNVSITTSPPSAAVLTDSAGVFVINNIEIGDHTVTAEKKGYSSNTVSISIIKDDNMEVTILLSPSESQVDSLFNSSTPQHQATDQPISVNLSWSVTNQKEDLKYDVLLYESNTLQERVVASNTADTTILVEGLKYNTTYFWQVIIKEGGLVSSGKLWSFKTEAPTANLFLFAREEDGNFEVYSSDFTNLIPLRLTQNPNRDWNPLLSPTRETIAYVSNQDIDPHIYIMDLDGSQTRKVTTLPIAGFHNPGVGFCWSPDGGALLYSNYDNLYRIDNGGSNLTLISKAQPGRHYRECDWTDQGDWIVALTIGEKPYDSEINLIKVDGSNPITIRPNLPGSIGSPSFSIDGEHILFTHDVSEFESDDGRQLDARIFTMDLFGSNLTDISHKKPDGTNDLQPRYSTNGAKIIFVNVSNDGLSPPELWMMNTDGNERELLFSNALTPS